MRPGNPSLVWGVLTQTILLDLVFSLDSVITAVEWRAKSPS
jgi:predicted tellurium resistance membrane protein TerC